VKEECLFGTNLCVTMATTIPNMVSGMLIILILPLFQWLRSITDYHTGGWIAAIIIMTVAMIAAVLSKETFTKESNFVEK